METMFMIPLSSPVTGAGTTTMYNNNNNRVATTTGAIKRNDTHDTCSCGGSEINASSPSSAKQLDASSVLQSSCHLRTTTTPATAATPILTSSPQQQQQTAADTFGMLEAKVADDLVKKTEQRVEHVLCKASFQFQTEQSIKPVPKFSLLADTNSEERDVDSEEGEPDLTRLELLGSGGFASVYSVDIKDPSRLRNHTPGQQYVVKHLSPKLALNGTTGGVSNRRKLHAGAKDIVLESHILSALDHHNIVSVHGLSNGGIQAWATTQRTDAYFMILPRLHCTLSDKISTWKKERLQKANIAAAAADLEKKQSKNSRGSWLQRLRSSPNKSSGGGSSSVVATVKQQIQAQQLEFLCERLEIVEQLCEAIEYLHSKRIMHRDIKPPNIGFDKEGCLKLFDFGLAKELPSPCTAYSTPVPENNNGKSSLFGSNGTTKTYQNLGNTGTTRYMAPEVIRRDPYNCKVDVYAASIVCWELMTLRKPYGTDVSGQFVKELVALYDDRPIIPSAPSAASMLFTSSSNSSSNKLQQQAMTTTVWPKSLKHLVQQGWIKDINTRLTATQMKHGLQEIVTKKKQQLYQLRVQMGEVVEEPTSSSSVKMNKTRNDAQSCVISRSLTTTMSC